MKALSAITYLTYQIRRTATYDYVEIHMIQNFPSICSGYWTICAEYDLRVRLLITGTLTLTGTRKPTVRCLITRPDYGNISHYQNSPHLKNMQLLDQTGFKIAIFHKQSNTMKGFANTSHLICKTFLGVFDEFAPKVSIYFFLLEKPFSKGNWWTREQEESYEGCPPTPPPPPPCLIMAKTISGVSSLFKEKDSDWTIWNRDLLE